MAFLKKIWNWLCRLFHFNPPPAPPNPPGFIPQYIEYPNEIQIPVPGNADQTMMYCFPLEGTYANLLNMCNQRLNFSPLSERLRYYPLTTHMMMVMSFITRGYTTDPNYKKYGYVAETGVQFFMPLAECTKNAQGQWVAQRMVCYIPYILIDNPFSLVCGREQMGFAKSMARFDFPDNPGVADKFGVDAYGFTKFDKANPQTAAFQPWLNINKTTDKPQPAGTSWKSHGEAWKAVKDTFERIPTDENFKLGLPFIIHELEDLLHADIPMVFLKQYRAVDKSEVACFQGVVAANSFLRKFISGWWLSGEYEVTFQDFASYPIMSDLGLPQRTVVKNPFWIEGDLTFVNGTAQWWAATS
ncbi:MAG: hypothetical protein H6569_13725 [Lewinellaceae bacterium]|nr:hypothetical protein [Lewinellaceae bacterium]